MSPTVRFFPIFVFLKFIYIHISPRGIWLEIARSSLILDLRYYKLGLDKTNKIMIILKDPFKINRTVSSDEETNDSRRVQRVEQYSILDSRTL